jgi:hypothetical protein
MWGGIGDFLLESWDVDQICIVVGQFLLVTYNLWW